MTDPPLRVYGYRWVVLAAFVLIAGMTQVLWISFAPVTSAAAQFYGKSDLMIGLLSMSFMVVYILMFLPAAWAIDTWGFKAAVGIGAALTGVFGLARGIFAADFTAVFICQVGLAAGQPFVLGAITKLAARWFPVRERATASGLGTLALYRCFFPPISFCASGWPACFSPTASPRPSRPSYSSSPRARSRRRQPGPTSGP
jgi:MFS family permease